MAAVQNFPKRHRKRKFEFMGKLLRGSRVQGTGYGTGFRVQGLVFRNQGLGLRVQGLGVQDLMVKVTQMMSTLRTLHPNP